MRRGLKIGGAVLAALLVLLGAAVGAVLYTEPGTRLAVAQLRGLLPAELELGVVAGRLGGRLEVHDLRFEQPGTRVSVARLWVQWSPAALLDGELAVSELGAGGVRYQATPGAPPAAEPFRLPERVSLPLAVHVDRVDVSDVELRLALEAAPVRIATASVRDAAFVDSRLVIDNLEVAAPLASGHGRLELTAARSYPLEARLEWRARPAGIAPLDGITELRGSLAALSFEQRLAEPYSAFASGEILHLVDPAAPMTVDGELAVDDVRLAAVRPGLPDATVSLQAEVSGPLDGLRIRADARGTDAQQRRFLADLQARLAGSTLELARLGIRQPGRAGRLVGAGTVALGAGVSAALDMQWQSLTWPLTGEPQVRSPRGSLTWSGPLDDYRVQIDTRLAALDLAPVDLQVEGGGSLEAVDVALRARSAAGSLDGRADVAWGSTPRAEVSWELAMQDLSALLPALAGTVSGTGRISGTLPELEIDADLQGADVRYAQYSLAGLDLAATVDLSGATTSRVVVDVRGADLGGTAIASLDLEATGTPDEHRAQVSLDAADTAAVLDLSGRIEDLRGASPAWHYKLHRGRVAYRQLAPWTLAEPAAGLVSAVRLRVAEQCWRSAAARLCLQGQRDPQGLAGRLALEDLQLDYLAPLLPADMSLHGAVNALAEVSQPAGGAVTGRAQVSTGAGRVAWGPADAQSPAQTELVFEPSRLDASLDASRAAAQLALDTRHGRIRAAVETAAAAVTGGAPLSEAPLTGRLEVDVPDLAFVAEFVPALADVGGHVAGALTFDGTFGAPRASGALALRDGTLRVLEQGLTVTALTAALEGRGADGLGLRAEAVSGGGELRLDGRLTALGGPPKASLSLTGNAFQVVDNSEARLFLSPELEVEADAERIAVRGEVVVPRAEITPGKRSPSAVTVSQDQVLVSRQDEPVADPRPLYAEVRLTLGDDVHFEGFGLSAGLAGSVLVKQEPDTPVTGSGEIELLDGEYRAYGQGLVIDSGRIYFAGGPITQPALDIRAVRRPEEGILVGAHVQGTLQEPAFELFSEPSMSQQEQLSWLVLGRSPDEAPEGQSSALNRAALAMGLKGGDFLAENLGERIGVDEIGIQTGSGEAGAPSDPEQAALVVGKYLSPRLYVSYGIGLFDPESVLKLQYELARRWTIVTESSGESTGADVLYSVEVGEAEGDRESRGAGQQEGGGGDG